jgi:hypothetical protein
MRQTMILQYRAGRVNAAAWKRQIFDSVHADVVFRLLGDPEGDGQRTSGVTQGVEQNYLMRHVGNCPTLRRDIMRRRIFQTSPRSQRWLRAMNVLRCVPAAVAWGFRGNHTGGGRSSSSGTTVRNQSPQNTESAFPMLSEHTTPVSVAETSNRNQARACTRHGSTGRPVRSSPDSHAVDAARRRTLPVITRRPAMIRRSCPCAGDAIPRSTPLRERRGSFLRPASNHRCVRADAASPLPGSESGAGPRSARATAWRRCPEGLASVQHRFASADVGRPRSFGLGRDGASTSVVTGNVSRADIGPERSR